MIDPYVIRHCMEHPARVEPFTVRGLAEHIGRSPAMIGHLRSGERASLSLDDAIAVANAFGVHPNVLFTPPLSTNPDDRSTP